MENVLYDLYIAEVEIDDNYFFFNNDSTRKQNLLNSVFKKHHINEQTFDTSLVWYNKNLDKYLKINTKVEDRLSALADTLKKQIDFAEESARRANTKNLLPDTTFFFLQASGLFQNRYVFKVETPELNSTHSLSLNFDVLGINDSIYPVLTFYMQCVDTTIVYCDTLQSNMHYSKPFSIPKEQKLNVIHASFFIPDKEKALIFFNDVSILKLDNALQPENALKPDSILNSRSNKTLVPRTRIPNTVSP